VKAVEEGTPAQVMRKEGERLLEKIHPDDYMVTLEIEGRSFSTEQFSKFLDERQETVRQSLVFVVGGHWGLSDQVRARATARLSLSKMTFNHEMVRLFLMEQIYRAFTILHHLPYHK
jgi:23S rRNA (pseudouridine1915-N3)-methyltransferase